MQRGSLIVTDVLFLLTVIMFVAGGQHAATVQTMISVAAILLLSVGSLIQHYTYYRLTKKIY
jgi:hypothetical protein